MTTAESSVAVDINSLNPIAPNAEMRENLTMLKGQVFGYNDFGEIIDEEFVVEEPIALKPAKVKAKIDDADTQLSLFDLFERDKNK